MLAVILVLVGWYDPLGGVERQQRVFVRGKFGSVGQPSFASKGHTDLKPTR
jgi:hypothetical protein